MIDYIVGADLPNLAVTWKDSSGNVIDYSSGYTFAAKVGHRGTTSFTKTTGITGAATSPNVLVQWANTGELNSLAPGIYVLEIIATETATTKQRKYQTRLNMKATLT